MKKSYIVNEDFINSRIDRWFRKKIYNVPQSLIEKSLRKGKIKVNNNKIKSSYKLQKEDKITLFNISFSNKKNIKLNYIPSKKELKYSSKLFIENNENFVVINKPAGIAVQSGTKSKRNILDILKNTHEFKGFYPYAVHRIDKETTGILIVAKNRKYAQLFTTLFRIRKIHKTYLAIAIGKPNSYKGTFTDELFYYEGKKKNILKAITHYKILDSNSNYSLLELKPETGRKHQLRKQLLIHACPVLGDDKYRLSENHIKKGKLMLHAYKIHFSINGIKYNFSAELPDFFFEAIKEKRLKTPSQ